MDVMAQRRATIVKETRLRFMTTSITVRFRSDKSVRNMDRRWHPSARRDPLLIGLKLDAKLVVVDPQVAVLATHDGLRHDCLHILRQHTDVSPVAAVVDKAIVAKAVSEMAEKYDIVLE